MKKYIVFLLLVISNITTLHANEPLKINVHALCSDSPNILNGEFFSTDSRKEEFSITISSNRLNLSEDALQDNTGGVVLNDLRKRISINSLLIYITNQKM